MWPSTRNRKDGREGTNGGSTPSKEFFSFSTLLIRRPCASASAKHDEPRSTAHQECQDTGVEQDPKEERKKGNDGWPGTHRGWRREKRVRPSPDLLNEVRSGRLQAVKVVADQLLHVGQTMEVRCEQAVHLMAQVAAHLPRRLDALGEQRRAGLVDKGSRVGRGGRGGRPSPPLVRSARVAACCLGASHGKGAGWGKVSGERRDNGAGGKVARGRMWLHNPIFLAILFFHKKKKQQSSICLLCFVLRLYTDDTGRRAVGDATQLCVRRRTLSECSKHAPQISAQWRR